MDIRQCKMCKRPLPGVAIESLCPSCLKSLDADTSTVKNYLYDNPQPTTLAALAEATGVKPSVIRYMLKENRIEMGPPVGGDTNAIPLLKCEVCKRPIRHGKLCDKCKRTLAKTVESVLPQEQKKSDAAIGKNVLKMHINTKNNKKDG